MTDLNIPHDTQALLNRIRSSKDRHRVESWLVQLAGHRAREFETRFGGFVKPPPLCVVVYDPNESTWTREVLTAADNDVLRSLIQWLGERDWHGWGWLADLNRRPGLSMSMSLTEFTETTLKWSGEGVTFEQDNAS